MTARGSQPPHPPDCRWDIDGYRLAHKAQRIDQIFVQRRLSARTVCLELVSYETTPVGDCAIDVPCACPDLGVHVIGPAAYTVSLWFQQHLGTLDALIEFFLPSSVRLLTHPDDERDVILFAEVP